MSELSKQAETLRNAEVARAAAEQTRLAKVPVEQLTISDVDKMTGDVYKNRLVSDKGFAAKVDELESKRPPRPRAN